MISFEPLDNGSINFVSNGFIFNLLSEEDWHTILADYKGGVDYPVSFFYKEIYKAYPNSKVIY